jgi:hypothetical protein
MVLAEGAGAASPVYRVRLASGPKARATVHGNGLMEAWKFFRDSGGAFGEGRNDRPADHASRIQFF